MDPSRDPRDDLDGVWSITCFVIDRDARRQGVAKVLLAAAVEHAFARGAAAIEAYPHVAKGDDYIGGSELYVQAGFAKVRDANKRAIVRIQR